MDLVPYGALIRSIVIQQLTNNGWVDLVRVPILNPSEVNEEDIQEEINRYHKMLYTYERVEFITQGTIVTIRGLGENTATFRVCASAESVSYPILVA